MSEIPADIQLEAEACYLRSEQMDSYGIVKTIAEYLMAERERCALVADFYAQSSVHSDWSDDARGAAYYACSDVANAIRNPASPLPNPSADTGDDLPF